MTVAAADPNGVPWATPVFYVNDGFRLYWLSAPRNRLGAYLRENPRAAVTILDSGRDWQSMRGLQVEGPVNQVDSWKERLSSSHRLLRKFPGLAKDLVSSPIGGHLRRNAPHLRLFCLDIKRCWFTDNSQGSGSRTELDLQ